MRVGKGIYHALQNMNLFKTRVTIDKIRQDMKSHWDTGVERILLQCNWLAGKFTPWQSHGNGEGYALVVLPKPRRGFRAVSTANLKGSQPNITSNLCPTEMKDTHFYGPG